MYTEPTKFETLLLEKSPKFPLTKTDYDLFLIGQARCITYEQLMYTTIHGKSGVGERLSLKRLEREFFILGKVLPDKRKYYTLTAKGKEYFLKTYGKQISHFFSIDIEGKLPSGAAQLNHRIRTNDFYYHYMAVSFAGLPKWEIELPYVEREENPPRCDARMKVGADCYYIEQDNCTQAEAVLENKLRQYVQSGLFYSGTRNHIVFTIHSAGRFKRKMGTEKSSYSFYRLLLKAEKVWKLIETRNGKSTTLWELLLESKKEGTASYTFLTGSDKQALEFLRRKHGNVETLTQLQELKTYYYKSSSQREGEKEKELLCWKRIKKFYHLIDTMTDLRSRLLNGMELYVMPNQQIAGQLPFLMPEASKLENKLKEVLYYSGLNYEEWRYYPERQVEMGSHIRLNLHQVFEYNHNVIVFLDISNNLRDRVQFQSCQQQAGNPLFILLVNRLEEALEWNKGQDVSYLYLNKPELIAMGQQNLLYVVDSQKRRMATLEYDSFTDKVWTRKGGY